MKYFGHSQVEMVAELGEAVQALPSEQLAGFPEMPGEWAGRKAEQVGIAELRLPAGMELPDDQALVYFYRPSRWLGSANAYRITVNDRHVTNVLDGGPKLKTADHNEGLEGVKKTKLMKAIEGSS